MKLLWGQRRVAADDKKVDYYVTRQPNILVGGKNYRVRGLQWMVN
jgi:hypothetical protein